MGLGATACGGTTDHVIEADSAASSTRLQSAQLSCAKPELGSYATELTILDNTCGLASGYAERGSFVLKANDPQNVQVTEPGANPDPCTLAGHFATDHVAEGSRVHYEFVGTYSLHTRTQYVWNGTITISSAHAACKAVARVEYNHR